VTLSEIETAAWIRLNLGEAPATRDQTRIRSFINETHRALLSRSSLRGLRLGRTTVASVADQAEYGLNQAVARLLTIRETTNDRTLVPRSREWYRAVEPDPAAATGTPDAYIPLGYGAVKRRPAGTGLWGVSTSAADTMVLRIRARTTSQTTTDSTLTLSGTSRVAFGALTTYDDVTSITLASAAAGTVSLYDAAAAGNELAAIPIGRTVSRYLRFALWPTPTAAVTYQVDYEHEIATLSNNDDEPLLPAEFHDLLWRGAIRDEYEQRDDNRYAVAEARFEARVMALQAYLYHAQGPPGRGERSTLGAGFPADRGTRWY